VRRWWPAVQEGSLGHCAVVGIVESMVVDADGANIVRCPVSGGPLSPLEFLFGHLEVLRLAVGSGVETEDGDEHQYQQYAGYHGVEPDLRPR